MHFRASLFISENELTSATKDPPKILNEIDVDSMGGATKPPPETTIYIFTVKCADYNNFKEYQNKKKKTKKS